MRPRNNEEAKAQFIRGMTAWIEILQEREREAEALRQREQQQQQRQKEAA